jgi:hypothetical protein
MSEVVIVAIVSALIRIVVVALLVHFLTMTTRRFRGPGQ